VNVIFLSPHFPPQFHLFCRALQREGATVLGLGDAPWHDLSSYVKESLTEYYYVPDMSRYDDVVRALGHFIHRHGRIDRIDSLNEYWLELEARLREDFNILGQRPSDTARNRSKSSMREIFKAAGVPSSEGERLASADHAWALARKYGYPLVFKPDVGVGAAHTFRVDSDEEIQKVLEQPLAGYVVERFVPYPLTSFDGLTTLDGRIVYETSHVYSAPIMDVVNQRLTMHYYSRREIPLGLAEMGRKIVKAFDVRGRFFHVELFDLGDDQYKALEINVTDLMNYGSDIDVYDLWAKVVLGKSLEHWHYDRKYFAAHASRRNEVPYRHPHEQLLKMLGDRLVTHRAMPPVLAGAMGDYAYFLRSPNEALLKEAIGLVEAVDH
jgi:hypothetical protein